MVRNEKIIESYREGHRGRVAEHRGEALPELVAAFTLTAVVLTASRLPRGSWK